MRRMSLALLAAASIVAVGCVIRTHHVIEAHVTVDIRHIDEQAESIVSYVKGQTDTLPPTAVQPAPEKPSAKASEKSSWLMRAVEVLGPMKTAYAAELKQSSERVKELADKMRQRHAQLQALKQPGCLGENNRGYVELRPCDDLKDAAKKNDAQRLVAAENGDRKALYNEIVSLNKDQGVALSVVERIFASKWIQQAQPGEQVQLPPAGADFEAFKKSPLGRKLGDAAKPDAWVTVK